MQYLVSVPKENERSRWRVVLVRLPEKPTPLLKERSLRPRDLPRVLRTTNNLLQAQQTVARLRDDGASVILMEEPRGDEVFCPDHPHLLATNRCTICQRRICTDCVHAAEGEPLCNDHAGVAYNRTRLIRLRQLFLLFLFSAFLYQVVAYFRADRARVNPAGPVSVAIFQYVPPGVRTAPIVRYLNDPRSPHKLDRIRVWFNRERVRYGGNRGYLNFDVFTPRILERSPPSLQDAGASVLQIGMASWRYLRFFDRLARQQGVRSDDYGARVFILYTDGAGDLAAHSRGSEQGRLAVSHVDLSETNPAYALTTIAHELGHVLGAADRYDPATFTASYPEGFVEPFADPLFPQRFAELMAVDIPILSDAEAEVRDLSQVRIGHQTAAEMDWLSPGAASAYYKPPSQRPEDRLPPRQVRLQVPVEDGGAADGGEGR